MVVLGAVGDGAPHPAAGVAGLADLLPAVRADLVDVVVVVVVGHPTVAVVNGRLPRLVSVAVCVPKNAITSVILAEPVGHLSVNIMLETLCDLGKVRVLC